MAESGEFTRFVPGITSGPASRAQADVRLGESHIGSGWGGGLVPIITTWAYASTGSLARALAYPICTPALMFLLALFLMPETRKISIWVPEEARTVSP